MNNYIELAGLDKSLKNELKTYTEHNKDKINLLAAKCNKNGFKTLQGKSDMMRLAVCIEYIKYTEEKYRLLGIDDEILKETMKDIGIWCKNNDNKGLKNYAWIQNHLKAELFKIGRLQYQFYRCNNPTFDYSVLPFDKGENTIFIHIPQGEKLIFSDCINSLKEAKSFFAKHFPNYKFDFFICESWLLYDENQQFMKPSCNILQFQSLFDIVMSKPDDRQAIERIFGKRKPIKRNYPENTSLQKSAKEFMLQGGKMGEGVGIIPISRI